MNSAAVNSIELKKMPSNETLKKDLLWERARCRNSCLYYLQKYAKIKDPNKLATIAWEPWPHLVYLLDIFARYRLIIILKAKQLGITWLVQGYNEHTAKFFKNANIITLSKGELEASEELDYAKFINKNMPPFLRLPAEPDQSSLVVYPDTGSKMRALPSTKASGVGLGAATRVVLDEFEYHEYAGENWAEIQPMIAAGGQVIILSTADALKSDTKFKEIFNLAITGKNAFFPVFLPYNLRPGRTEEWWNTLPQRENISEYDRACRFPRIIDDALKTVGIFKFFEFEPLKQMLADCVLKPELRHNGLVKIYKPVRLGAHYFSGIDISDGRYDFTAMPIMDWQTGEIVATFHAMIPADEATYIIAELGKEYNNALLAPERNQPGLAVINKLKDLSYPNLYYMASDKPGWWTSGGSNPTSRGSILHELRVPLSKRGIVIYDPEAIKECMNFIQPKDDVPRAKTGTHDDWVMALAITWQLRKFIRPAFTATSWRYEGI